VKGEDAARQVLDDKVKQIQAAIRNSDAALVIVLAYELHRELQSVLYDALLRRIQEVEEK